MRLSRHANATNEHINNKHKHLTTEQLFGMADRDLTNRTPVPPHANKKIETMLQESEAEFRRRGKFRLIFPFKLASVSSSAFKALYGDRVGFSGQPDKLGKSDSANCAPNQSTDLNACLLERFSRKGIFNENEEAESS